MQLNLAFLNRRLAFKHEHLIGRLREDANDANRCTYVASAKENQTWRR
jgi:hypothetical protein